MKFTGKGIGWLIAGALVCVSAFPGDSIGSILSTVAIGLVFIAVYLMKQRFRPAGLGWFIGGGILIAFCVDCLFEMLEGAFSHTGTDSGLLSDMLIGFICACGCIYMFYRKNKEVLEDVANGADYSEESEFPYQEEVFKEETVETVETVETLETVVEETRGNGEEA